MTAPDSARLELKFRTDQLRGGDILQWLRDAPVLFLAPYPARSVNNIYFDSLNYDSLRNHVSGMTTRAKVRYRWYGEGPGIGRGALEIKFKHNQLGWKSRYPIAGPLDEESAAWRSVARNIAHMLPAEGKLWLHSRPLAVLRNVYRRQYFVTVNEKVRLTVDTDQIVWDPNGLTGLNQGRGIRQPDVVVELKFAPADRDYACRLTQAMPLNASKYSKYVALSKATMAGL